MHPHVVPSFPPLIIVQLCSCYTKIGCFCFIHLMMYAALFLQGGEYYHYLFWKEHSLTCVKRVTYLPKRFLWRETTVKGRWG